MDLSKLPRLSKTETPTGDPNPPATPGVEPTPAIPASPYATPQTFASWCVRCGAPMAPGANFCNSCGTRAAGGAGAGSGLGIEAWISIGLGLFLLFIAPMGVKYWSAKLTGRTFAPYDHPENPGEKADFTRWQDMQTGAITDIKYTETSGFWSDNAITLFAIVLILDGIVAAFVRKKPLVLLTFLLTILATVGNLAYLIATFNQGFAILSFLAVLIGGMMIFLQWQLLQSLRASEYAQRRAVA